MQRRFSLEDDFMNFKVDDLLYGFMRSISTANPTDNGKWEEYLDKKEFTKNKKTIAEICGCSVRTIERHVNELFARGLLEEDKIKIDREMRNGNFKTYEYDVYRFPYDYNGKYQLINKNMLRYLIYTRNAHAIKIYIYLLNKYKWKPGYTFTITELREALGYSAATKGSIIDDAIKAILLSFNRENIIVFERIKMMEEVNGKEIPIERMKLNFVEEEVEEF